ncbi:hypothetical protein OIU77_015254 [Salix suchowensis]|uniref:Uncharacterized protein n=1 Tax=Salix suchowensis TaxID=1278906 RepID=A0ABQ8ZSS0_9ROSI|nr:hypothetical protein OIU77_015254 [Salix suchowensis]
MNCARCLCSNGKLDEGIGDVDESTYENCMPNQEVFDIGGFAAIAGCLDKLKSSEKQVGTPLEEDLGSLGHHFHPTSVPDTILQASAGDKGEREGATKKTQGAGLEIHGMLKHVQQ